MENLLFNQLNISDEVLKGLEKMGFEESTPIQGEAIPHLLEGKDVMALAPTGTGKTCAFGVPTVDMVDPSDGTIQALVLCPTRELVIQIAKELEMIGLFKKGLRVTAIYGGQPIERQIVSLKRKPQIIVATPGRVMDHMRRRTVRLEDLRMIILDEADEMLNMGFRDDINEILKSVPERRQTALFSATYSKEVKALTKKYQTDSVFIKTTTKELTVDTVKQYYVEVKNKDKASVLANLLDVNQFKLSLAFCNTKRMVDDLTSELNSLGYSAEALHGDMKQVQRDRVMDRYRKGTLDILVATDVAARGIDVNDIEAVFNYDVPKDDEYYVHRIGRTGRAKKTGIAYTLATPRDMSKLRTIMSYTKVKIERMAAPTSQDVLEIKTKKVLKEVTKLQEKGKLEKYTSLIEKMIESSEKELSPMDVAAALLKIHLKESEKGKEVKPKKNTIATQSGAEAGMVRLFINLGSLDKIQAKDIIKLIASRTSMEGSQMGVIKIYDKFTFFEVPVELGDEVMQKVIGTKHGKRRVNIEVANSR